MIKSVFFENQNLALFVVCVIFEKVLSIGDLPSSSAMNEKDLNKPAGIWLEYECVFNLSFIPKTNF
jgi:hypothetical protein